MPNMQKLVRDRIPALIEADGRLAVVRTLSDDEYLAALIAKVAEEQGELSESPGIEELADILEVVLALADVLGSRADLEAARVAKFAERGGFAERTWLESVE